MSTQPQCTGGPEYTQSSDVAHKSNLMSLKAKVLTDRVHLCQTSIYFFLSSQTGKIHIALPLLIDKHGQLQ